MEKADIGLIGLGVFRCYLRLQQLLPRLRLHRYVHLHRTQDLFRHHQHG